MSYDPRDTIAAIATSPGGAFRGMVRVSGPKTIQCLQRHFAPRKGPSPAEVSRAQAIGGHWHLATRVDDDDADHPDVLPCDLFWWPNERSYTRQPLAELHTIGSPPLLQQVLDDVCAGGARLAEPGEFTLRAFLAGRLDLTQAEGVLGVVNATGQAQLDAALSQLAGGISRPLHTLREELLQLLAELEAGLDFVDEDIQFISHEQIHERLAAANLLLDRLAQQMEQRSLAATAVRVVLVGPANAGKSRLFNAMVERFGVDAGAAPKALVSGQAGTTRDYLIARIDLGGVACELADTAGTRTAPEEDAISLAAEAMADEQQQRAEIVLRCIDPTQADTGASAQTPSAVRQIIVVTKCDLAPDSAQARAAPWESAVVTSSHTGAGVEALASRLRATIGATSEERSQILSGTADRCRSSIRLASSSLARAGRLAKADGGDELIAAEIRTALEQLGLVVGAVYTDDILDRIFSSFCIGK